MILSTDRGCHEAAERRAEGHHRAPGRADEGVGRGQVFAIDEVGQRGADGGLEEGRPEGQQGDHGEGDPDGVGIDREEQTDTDEAAGEVGAGQHEAPVEAVREHARDGRGHQERGHLQHQDDRGRRGRVGRLEDEVDERDRGEPVRREGDEKSQVEA